MDNAWMESLAEERAGGEEPSDVISGFRYH